MGGKTGTAQVVALGERRRRSFEMAYKHRDHAWLAAWGKKEGKSYVVIVMVEHGGGGSSAAGPVCAEVFNALFGPDAGKGVGTGEKKALPAQAAAIAEREAGRVTVSSQP